jgi:hypothetical protein
MASITVFKAVSTPIAISVSGRSLSIVAGIPIVFNPKALKSRVPRKVPSPPIVTKPSISNLRSFFKAISRPSLVLNFSLREVLRIVPPLCIIPPTDT